MLTVYGLMVYLGPFIITIAKFKKGPAITSYASYSLGSCPLLVVIALPGKNSHVIHVCKHIHPALNLHFTCHALKSNIVQNWNLKTNIYHPHSHMRLMALAL